MIEKTPVARILRCHAKPGRAEDCMALLEGLLQGSRQIPGCVFASLIPPAAEREPHQFVQRFATLQDLARWQESAGHAQWRERLEQMAEVVDAGPIEGLQVWTAPPVPVAVPPKWKLTVVSWMGIFPLVAVSLGLLTPLLQSWPFLARILLVTVLVVSLMSYVVMPRLVRWMGWWLRGK
ncbi:antibiotic biosynthesis monooxygenase [Comamonas endophytica]|uniref:Antibiotic biosynthesis monooxygenase n=1 Tax=Comamonas endophytica TaxID=2949090 RepID=A0ABY6GHJ3_9BURK|nr:MULTISPECIES: antibiotic biosynthesis monooxygenase [unclassified Acidovorax]MCD2513390.1 antibiotic biosynthesis monooxygenase [Acidovorax sp. D4N7]UYG53827.1 antibiotic biosynthesis monooxygenase [Acidovorax sp. 5MLIR]